MDPGTQDLILTTVLVVLSTAVFAFLQRKRPPARRGRRSLDDHYRIQRAEGPDRP